MFGGTCLCGALYTAEKTLIGMWSSLKRLVVTHPIKNEASLVLLTMVDIEKT